MTAVHKTKRLLYRFRRIGKKGGAKTLYRASQHELLALQPGRYQMMISTPKGRLLEHRTVTIQRGEVTQLRPPIILECRGGVLGSQKTGTELLGGGSLGLRYGIFGIQLQAWGSSLSFPTAPTSHQLYLELRTELGYQGQWRWFSLFAGGYVGFGFTFQDVTDQLRVGGVFNYGAACIPGFRVSPGVRIALHLDAGFSLFQINGGFQHLFQWSAQIGLQFLLL